MSDYATVTAPTSKLPTLSAGEVTPTVAAEFEFACKNYFSTKGIEDAKHVATILGCFQDVHVQGWLRPDAEHERVSKLTFSVFMAEFRERFLHPNWESITRTQLMQCRMKAEETFEKYHTRIVSIHSLLIGTSSQLDDTRLRHTIEGNMVADLQHRHNHDSAAKAIAADKLSDWIARVKVLDRDRRANIEDIQHELEIIRKAEKRKAEGEGGGKSKKSNNEHRSNSSSTANGSGSSSSTSTARERCPTLTTVERELLNKHRGCTKCRQPYVNHKAVTCPNDYPPANNYTALTEAMCLAAKPSSTPAANASAPAPIAATLASIVDDSDDSAMDEDLSLPHNMSKPPSHRSEHLRWKCLVEGPGRDFPLTVRSLIDDGAHLALIEEDLVETLKLPRYELPEPE
ncbi:hypothetical protein C8J57DRAFT_1506947 [Mycena rebaudengoi]|nr:hypothetical protein C8J57DRAFT_1094156 [Mycena rebaudengoi]KAJ7273431.1 hypothetical protein C8J57DRAFT_1506947 [Mycena rebaudengoi]